MGRQWAVVGRAKGPLFPRLCMRVVPTSGAIAPPPPRESRGLEGDSSIMPWIERNKKAASERRLWNLV
jgi:hypothetical protein